MYIHVVHHLGDAEIHHRDKRASGRHPSWFDQISAVEFLLVAAFRHGTDSHVPEGVLRPSISASQENLIHDGRTEERRQPSLSLERRSSIAPQELLRERKKCLRRCPFADTQL